MDIMWAQICLTDFYKYRNEIKAKGDALALGHFVNSFRDDKEDQNELELDVVKATVSKATSWRTARKLKDTEVIEVKDKTEEE